jgi:hypothetical protein
VRVSNRLLLVIAPAALLACADLIVKATVHTPWWAFHHRSNAWVVLSMILLVAAGLLAFVPSRLAAVAAGMMAGGALGNLLSARWDGNWVPNPLVIGGYGYGVAFNLADVFFIVGNVALMTALIVVALHHREQVARSRDWERALLRRLRDRG